MKLKLFLVLGLLYQTAYGWDLRKPYNQWTQKDKDEYQAAKKRASLVCENEAYIKGYGHSSGEYDDCMRKKGWR
jgi:hypothetical protein